MKEQKKINLSTCLIIMAFFLVALLTVTFLLVNKMNKNKPEEEKNEAKQLNQTNIVAKQNTVIENKQNTTNETQKEKNDSQPTNTETSEFYIEGTYTSLLEDYPSDAPNYIFTKDGNVSVEGLSITRGTYSINNNKILMKFNYALAPTEDVPREDFYDEQVGEYIDETHIKVGNAKLEKMIPMTVDDMVGKWVVDANEKILGAENASLIDIGYGSLGPGSLELDQFGNYIDSVAAESVNSDAEKDFRGGYELKAYDNDYLMKLNPESGKEPKTFSVYSGKIIYPITYNNKSCALVLVKAK